MKGMQATLPQIWLRPLVLLALGLWTLISYSPALRGPFFFDDEHFIVRNEMVHSLDHVAAIYSSAVTDGASIKGNFYRPNQQLIYALLYRLVGTKTSVPYHLSQVALHIGAGYSLFFICLNLGLGLVPAAFGAAVFLLHPVQTEAVAYISGLADPLAAFFGLAALAMATRWLWGSAIKNWVAFSVVQSALLVLALFSKENAVVFGPMIMLLMVASGFAHPQVASGQSDMKVRLWMVRERSQLGAVAVAMLLSCLWVILKVTVFKFGDAIGLTSEVNAYTQSLGLRLTTYVCVLWDYAKLIVWPSELFYEKPYRAYADLWTARGIFGLGCLSVAAAGLAQMRRWPRLSLSLGWFFAAMMPFVGVIPLNSIFLEHWLYMPMIGLALGLALVFNRSWGPSGGDAWTRRRLATLGISLTLLVAASIRTYARAGEWADVEAFYLGELRYAPDSGRIYNNLGMYYADHHDEVKAIRYYQLAASSPTGRIYAQPHHNLAIALLNAGRQGEAIDQIRIALRIDPGFVYSLHLLHSVFAAAHDEIKLAALEAALRQLQSTGTYDVAAFVAVAFGPE